VSYSSASRLVVLGLVLVVGVLARALCGLLSNVAITLLSTDESLLDGMTAGPVQLAARKTQVLSD
jgi:hypothetical protein